MNDDYSNREIDHLMKEVHEKLDLILSQTTKTNGRVTKLEMWRSFLIGSWAIISLIVLPLLSYVYFHDFKILSDKIEDIKNK